MRKAFTAVMGAEMQISGAKSTLVATAILAVALLACGGESKEAQCKKVQAAIKPIEDASAAIAKAKGADQVEAVEEAAKASVAAAKELKALTLTDDKLKSLRDRRADNSAKAGSIGLEMLKLLQKKGMGQGSDADRDRFGKIYAQGQEEDVVTKGLTGELKAACP